MMMWVVWCVSVILSTSCVYVLCTLTPTCSRLAWHQNYENKIQVVTAFMWKSACPDSPSLATDFSPHRGPEWSGLTRQWLLRSRWVPGSCFSFSPWCPMWHKRRGGRNKMGQKEREKGGGQTGWLSVSTPSFTLSDPSASPHQDHYRLFWI